MGRYTNYAMKNNVFAELDAPLWSLATTVQLKTWQWARRWSTFPILATLENFDGNGKVLKREIVRITAISWDNLTIVRWVAPCPSSDDDNTQSTNTYSFNADDKISLYITKEHFDKIGDWFTNVDNSFDDVYENWTDQLRTYQTTWLWIEVKPWKVLVWSAYYDFEWWELTLTDNATNYVEINSSWILVSNTTDWNDKNVKIAKVITSWWQITSIEDWRLATIWWEVGWVNIHELTEKKTLAKDDEFIIADSENIYNNKKITAWSIFLDTWDWSDWDCVIDWAYCYMCAKEWHFDNLTICDWATLRFCGDWPLILKVKNCLCNLWKIDTRWFPKDDYWFYYHWYGRVWQVKNKIWACPVCWPRDCPWFGWGVKWEDTGVCCRGWNWWASWQDWCSWCWWGAWWCWASCAWWGGWGGWGSALNWLNATTWIGWDGWASCAWWNGGWWGYGKLCGWNGWFGWNGAGWWSLPWHWWDWGDWYCCQWWNGWNGWWHFCSWYTNRSWQFPWCWGKWWNSYYGNAWNWGNGWVSRTNTEADCYSWKDWRWNNGWKWWDSYYWNWWNWGNAWDIKYWWGSKAGEWGLSYWWNGWRWWNWRCWKWGDSYFENWWDSCNESGWSSVWWKYGLLIVAKNIYNTCIDAHWWNGGCWVQWGYAGDWGDVHLIYDCCIDNLWSINVKGWKWGCSTCWDCEQWKDWVDWQMCISKLYY